MPDTLTNSIALDLVGAPYAHLGRGPAYDCFGLVLEVQGRLGYAVGDPIRDYDEGWAGSGANLIARNFSSHWTKTKTPQVGDAVALRMGRDRTVDHVGVVIEDGYFLQAIKDIGVIRSKLSSFKSRIAGFYRPRTKLHEKAVALADAHAPAAHSRGVSVTLITDMFDPNSTRTVYHSDLDGDAVADYIPEGWYGDPEHTLIIHRGKGLKPHEWESTLVCDGDDIVIAKVPGVGAAIVTALATEAFAATATGIAIATAINIAIAVGLSLVISLLTPGPKAATQEEGSPTFNYSGIKNSYRNGLPIPVVYGTHRTGGQVIQIYNDVLPNGKTTLNMLVALSQGQIQSIGGFTSDFDGVSDASIPDSFLLDGNKMNLYTGVTISGRMGQIDQLGIPGFQRTISGIPVDQTLGWDPPGVLASAGGAGVPFIHETTSAVNEVQVNLFFPRGLVDIDQNGPDTWSVHIKFEYRLHGTSTWTQVNGGGVGSSTKFEDAISSPFSRKMNIVFPTRDYYDVRITRILGEYPEQQAERSSQVDINSINEILYDDLTYPGLALLAVKAIASDQLNGGTPTITSLLEGKLVFVWDPTTPEDNPKFNLRWSDDPAWCSYDVLTNRTYGGGNYFSACDPVLSSFKTASDFFAELVPDGRGNTHKRGSFNFVYDKIYGLWEAANLPLAPFRAGLVLAGRRVRINLERETLPTQMFNMSNIKRGSFSGNNKSLVRAPNIVEVQYVNEETDYEPDIMQRFDTASLAAGDPIRIVTVSYPGVTHPARAASAAQYVLNVERLLRKNIVFEAGVDAVVTQPGDVFAFSHDVVGAGGGRIASVTVNGNGSLNLTFDRATDTSSVGGSNRRITIETDSSVDTWQMGPNGVVDAGDTVLVFNTGGSPAVTPVPVVGDKYGTQADGSAETQVILYRCTGTHLTQDLMVEIEGTEYNEDSFDDDPGTVETFTDTLPDPRAFPENPTLYLSERTVIGQDGKSRSIVDVSWQGDGDPEVDIYIRGINKEGA